MTRSYISPDFLIALINSGSDRNLLRRLAKQIPTTVVFEACAANLVTPEGGAQILMLQKESNFWIIRQFQEFLNIFYVGI